MCFSRGLQRGTQRKRTIASDRISNAQNRYAIGIFRTNLAKCWIGSKRWRCARSVALSMMASPGILASLPLFCDGLHILRLPETRTWYWYSGCTWYFCSGSRHFVFRGIAIIEVRGTSFQTTKNAQTRASYGKDIDNDAKSFKLSN